MKCDTSCSAAAGQYGRKGSSRVETTEALRREGRNGVQPLRVEVIDREGETRTLFVRSAHNQSQPMRRIHEMHVGRRWGGNENATPVHSS